MSLVTLRSYRDPIDAELAKSRLEDAGIRAFIFDEHLVSIQWLYSRAIGGVKVKVEGSDAYRAEQLLREDRSSDFPDEQGSVDLAESCPACKSAAFHHSRFQRNAAALSLLTSLPLIAWRRRWVCDACGHTWRPSPAARSDPPAETLAAEEEVREERSYPIIRVIFVALLCLAILHYVQAQIRSPS